MLNHKSLLTALFSRRIMMRAAASMTWGVGLVAHAQEKLLRIVVPVPAGGNLDAILRPIASSIAKPLNRQVVVDNRPGAAGLIGTRAVQTATPDGSTLLYHYIGLAGLPFTQKGANYDAAKDFVPVAMLAEGPAYIVVNSNVPARTLSEFIAWAKTINNGVESATSGPGGGSHMWTLLLAKRAGIDLLPVPYKGGAEQAMALVQGDAKILISNMSEALNGQVKAGKLRILAVCSDQISPITPDVPIAKDTVPGFVIAGWMGLFAPAGTPANEISNIAAAVKRAVDEPGFREKCAGLYVDAHFEGPVEFTQTMIKTIEFWRRLVVDLSIAPQ